MPTWNLVNVKYDEDESTSIIVRTELFDEFVNFCRDKGLTLLINSSRKAISSIREEDNIENVIIIRCNAPKDKEHDIFKLYQEFLKTFYLPRALDENLFAGDIYDIIAESSDRHLQKFGNKQTDFEHTSADDVRAHTLEDTGVAMIKMRKPVPIRQALQDRLIKSILDDHKTSANGSRVDPIEANQERDNEILRYLDLLGDNRDILQKSLIGNYTILDLYIEACEKQMVPVNKQILQKFIELGAYTCIVTDQDTGVPIKSDTPVPVTSDNINSLSINFNMLLLCLANQKNIPSIREGIVCAFLSCMASEDRQILLTSAAQSKTILDNYLSICAEQFHPVSRSFFNALRQFGAVSIRGLNVSKGVPRALLVKNTDAINVTSMDLGTLVELISSDLEGSYKVSKIRRLIKALTPHERHLRSVIDGKYTLLDLYLKHTSDGNQYISKLVLESLLANNVGLYIENGVPTSIEIIRGIIENFSNNPSAHCDTVFSLNQLGLIIRNEGKFFIAARKPCNYYKDCQLSDDPYSSSALIVTYEVLTDN